MKIKLIHPNAKLPTRGTRYAAGADLYAVADNVVLPGVRIVIPTGICIELQEFYWAQIAPRSGLAVQHGIMTMAGVIDADYRGEIKVVLYNSSNKPFEIKAGDRIAQLIVHRQYAFEFEVVPELSDTVRGEGGFGSTGIT